MADDDGHQEVGKIGMDQGSDLPEEERDDEIGNRDCQDDGCLDWEDVLLYRREHLAGVWVWRHLERLLQLVELLEWER